MPTPSRRLALVWVLLSSLLIAHAGADPIHEFARVGDVNRLKALLDEGADASGEYDGWTPLGLAILSGKPEAVRLLVTRGADPQECACQGRDWDALTVAVAHDKREIATLLLELGAKHHFWTATAMGDIAALERLVKETYPEGNVVPAPAPNENVEQAPAPVWSWAEILDVHVPGTAWQPIDFAAGRGQLEMVKFLLAKGVRTDRDGDGTVLCAALDGYEEVARYLLDAGAAYTLRVAAALGDTEKVRGLIEGGEDANQYSPDSMSALHCAASAGKLETAKLLIDSGASMDAIDSSSRSPLCCAVENGHVAMVSFLLDRGSPISPRYREYMSPLSAAVAAGRLEVTRLLLERGADPNTTNNRGETALIESVSLGYREIADLLWQQDAVRNYKTPADYSYGDAGQSHLHIAVASGKLLATEFLLNQGVNPNAMDNQGCTPLLLACTRHIPEIVQLLISHKADVNLADDDGVTPIMAAAGEGDLAVVRALAAAGAKQTLWIAAALGDIDQARQFVAGGADINEPGAGGRTPLQIALANEHSDLAIMLVKRGAAVEGTDREWLNRTPLHVAAANGNAELAKLLMEKGATADATDALEQTPLHLAASSGNAAIVNMLLATQDWADPTDNEGRTPLHLAAAGGHMEAAQALLEAGADPDTRDNSGSTPLKLASRGRHVRIEDLLQPRTSTLGAIVRAPSGATYALVVRSDTRTEKEPELKPYILDKHIWIAAKPGDLVDPGVNLAVANFTAAPITVPVSWRLSGAPDGLAFTYLPYVIFAGIRSLSPEGLEDFPPPSLEQDEALSCRLELVPDALLKGVKIGPRKEWDVSEERRADGAFFFAHKERHWAGGFGIELGSNPQIRVPHSAQRATTYKVTFTVREGYNWEYEFDPQVCIRVQ